MALSDDGYRIRIRKGAKVHEAPFDGETLILGSGGGAGIRLEDPRISNLHVLLKREQGRITAIDLDSEHGTRLGENLIRRPVPIGEGDVLRMGSYEVEVLHPPRRVPPPSVPEPTRIVRNTLAVPATTPLPVSMENPRARPAAERRDRAGGGLGLDPRVWSLIDGPLPEDRRPTATDFVLQVSLVWGDRLISVVHFPKGVDATLGASPEARVRLFSPGIDDCFRLASWRDDRVELAVPPVAALELRGSEEVFEAEALRTAGRLSGPEGGPSRIALAMDERARMALGAFGLLVRFVRPPEAVKGLGINKAELVGRALAGFLLMIGIGILVTVGLQPPPPTAPAHRLEESAKALARYLPRPKKKTPAAAVHKDASGKKDDEGKSGDQKRDQTEHRQRRRAARRVDARNRALHAGLLGAVPSSSKLFGSGGLGTGIDRALSGLKGNSPTANAHGFGGLAPRGGGGANATGLGIGGLGTHGVGTGGGGFGTVDLGGKGREVTRIIPGKTTVVGGLSRDVIERVIRRHESEIKYCYEIELGSHPELAGKVAVAFTIDAHGQVSTANVSESTLGNAATEHCMIRKIRRWRFPKPLGGGVVAVDFPWIFKPAGR